MPLAGTGSRCGCGRERSSSVRKSTPAVSPGGRYRTSPVHSASCAANARSMDPAKVGDAMVSASQKARCSPDAAAAPALRAAL